MANRKSKEVEDRNYEVMAQIYAIIHNSSSIDHRLQSIILKRLLKQDFDINYRILKNKCVQSELADYSVLELAWKDYSTHFCSNNYSGFMQLFINCGANFTSQNDNGDTILHQIAKSIEPSFGIPKSSYYDSKGKLSSSLADIILSAHVKLKNTSNPCDKNGISHFHIACMFNHTAAVEFFLTHGIDVNQTINSDSLILPGYTPLHLAARYSAFETFKLLLDHNADTNLKDSQSVNPLYLLIQRTQVILDWTNMQKVKLPDHLIDETVTNEKMIQLLLKKTKMDEIGLSQQHIACTLRGTTTIEKMLVDGKSLKNSIRADSSFWPGYTPLHFAAHFNLSIFRLLLLNGANIMAKDASGNTPFDLCLPRCPTKVIHSIINDVLEWKDITFIDNTTKLSDVILSMTDGKKFESFFKKTGVNANMSLPADSPLWPGYTILHIAVILAERICPVDDFNSEYDDSLECSNQGYLKRIKLCLDMGADVTITNTDNCTPLHLAFYLQNRFVVDLLLQYHHKIVNIIGNDNLSHIHLACLNSTNSWYKDIEITAKLIVNLLEMGVDVNCKIKTNFKYQFRDHERNPFIYISSGWSCLHIAVAAGNNKFIKILLEHGADLYAQDCQGMTPIHHILQSALLRVDSKDIFLSLESLQNCTTNFGLSHLHIACYCANLEAIKKLLDQGADVEATINYSQIRSNEALKFLAHYDGYKPIHFLLERNDFIRTLDIVELLIERGANIFAKTADGTTPLNITLEQWLTRYYLDDNRILLLTDSHFQKVVEDTIGLTKLHVACLTLKIEEVKKLLSNGANVNAQIHMHSPVYPGCTPLHLIIFKELPVSFQSDSDDDCPSRTRDKKFQDHVKKIRDIGLLLLKHGANVMIKNAQGDTPIHKGIKVLWSNDKFHIDWILNGHTDFTSNPTDLGGISHFHVACLLRNKEIVKKFLENGVDVNRRFGYFTDKYSGVTAFHLACMTRCRVIIDLLVKQGVNVNERDFFGNTPLHILAKNRDIQYYESEMKILIEAGADINIKNCLNETPVTLSYRVPSSPKILEFMLAKYRCRLNLFLLENDRGVLGKFWSCKTYPKSVLNAITNAPAMNDIDERGRTVIHNIVSTNPRNSPSTKDYAEIISKFIKSDFDADYQDDKGQTALHKASIFKNVHGIAGLLMNGANINIVDSSKKSALAYIITDNKARKMYLNIIRAFAFHAYKLQICGLNVSNANIKLISESSLNPYEVKECDNELNRLKHGTIGSSSVSLYEFISKTYSHLHLLRSQHDVIIKIFETNENTLREYYPQFVGLLLMQYRNVFVKSLLIEEAKVALNCVTKFIFPDLCSEKIVWFLPNGDLKKLMIASATM